MNIPEEFTFHTNVSPGPYTAKKIPGGYAVKFGDVVVNYAPETVKALVEQFVWIINQPNIKFLDDYIEPLEDMINKPHHYHKGSIDIVSFLEQHYPERKYTVSEGFAIGNVHKYTSRYKEKGGLEDLKKADFYTKKLMGYESQ